MKFLSGLLEVHQNLEGKHEFFHLLSKNTLCFPQIKLLLNDEHTDNVSFTKIKEIAEQILTQNHVHILHVSSLSSWTSASIAE